MPKIAEMKIFRAEEVLFIQSKNNVPLILVWASEYMVASIRYHYNYTVNKLFTIPEFLSYQNNILFNETISTTFAGERGKDTNMTLEVQPGFPRSNFFTGQVAPGHLARMYYKELVAIISCPQFDQNSTNGRKSCHRQFL